MKSIAGYKLQVTAMETVDMKVNVASSRWLLAKYHIRIHVVSKSKIVRFCDINLYYVAISNTVTK